MYDDIIRFLDEHKLKAALDALGRMAKKIDDWHLQSEVETLQETYGYMLKYASRGIDDPERVRIYRKICNTAYELADQIDFRISGKEASGFFAEKFRSIQSVSVSLQGIRQVLETFDEDMGMAQWNSSGEEELKNKRKALALQHEKCVDELFDWVWTSAAWTEDEEKELDGLLRSAKVPVNDLCVLVSAVTLNLITVFDRRKFLFLFDAYRECRDSFVIQRALVGMALAVYFHEKRIKMYPDLLQVISSMKGIDGTAFCLFEIQKAFLMTRETERIGKKMSEDIFPKMVKEYNLHLKDITSVDIDEVLERNPSWNSDMSQLQDSINELGKLQQEGADTNMVTFSNLKHFPFFDQVSHWFYLFDVQIPEVQDVYQGQNVSKNSVWNLLLSSPQFCNSDKFSFCFMVGSLPPSQMRYMNEQVISDSEITGKVFKDSSLGKQDTSVVVGQYIHDLYRFYKLWKGKKELKDIFQTSLSFWNTDLLKPLLDVDGNLRGIADYLLSKNYLDEALALYLSLSEKNYGNAEIWQKIGYIYQEKKCYDKAIDAFLKAEVISPEDGWTLECIASCSKRMGNYDRALEYYLKVEERKPDKLSVAFGIGQCYVNMNRFDAALPYFFKWEYLGKHPEKAWKAIAWCEFMIGKYAEAEEFCKKFASSNNVSAADWLNYGHVLWVQHRTPEALDCYRQALAMSLSPNDFRKAFEADLKVLSDKGIDEENIYMLPDML